MFIAYDVSLELIGQLRTLMPAIKRADRNLADQIGRAATSIALNLSEGRCRSGGDARRLYEVAHGSAAEVRAALAVGVAWGWIDEQARIHVVLDRLLGLLWGLTRGPRRPALPSCP
jgi:four helix bundle protein